jgi:hypothetical protein
VHALALRLLLLGRDDPWRERPPAPAGIVLLLRPLAVLVEVPQRLLLERRMCLTVGASLLR